MRQRLLLSVTALTLFGLVLPAARAQYNPFPVYNPGRLGGGAPNTPYYPNTSTGPRLSPYLLLNTNPVTGVGSLPAVNYFLGVLPEIERRNTQTLFQSEITNLNQRMAAGFVAPGPEVELFGGTLPPTGHGVTYLNPAPYYHTAGGAGRGAGLGRVPPVAGATGLAPASSQQPTYIPGTGAKGSGMR
jgi:hypothetical protein